ncbi:MAG TPA: hypothetical protein VFO26_08100 [Gaiella sp.]|uniref:hypothetical protein n=1 Tax=Gaiella sp. TaxID=2663207 RepID=UPI002D805E99|nr:hypothetical protein [Gaiella sp.]HET9287503.1 hypothetical protein [Gaiella sp.]
MAGGSRPSTPGSSRQLIGLQGAYYVATGAWAIVHRRSFEAVTGRKTDYWLVRTVGLLAAAIGASLLVAATREERPSPEAVALAGGSAASFALVDVVYVWRRRISPIYLADAALHALLAALALAARPGSRGRALPGAMA